MPPVFPGVKADTLAELARKLGLPEVTFMRTLDDYNAACRVGTFDHTALDDCHTEGLTPAKTHWARPIDTAAVLRLRAQARHHLHLPGPEDRRDRRRALRRPAQRNLFVAGEMMAGNVLGKGYTAGVGMSIGTAFGRIAGTQAAQAAVAHQQSKERQTMQQLEALTREAARHWRSARQRC
jgi:tricarballylate dehydrogenase